MEILTTFEGKINALAEKLKTLKAENEELKQTNLKLINQISQKDSEIAKLTSDVNAVKKKIEDIIDFLDRLGIEQ